MKKRITLILALSACMLMAACGKKETTTPASTPAEEPVVEGTTEIFEEESGELLDETADEETGEMGEVVEEVELNSDIEVVEDRVILTVDANASTGYTWKYKIEDESILEMVSDEYVEGTSEEGAVGVPGKEYITFAGKAEGSTGLYLYYVAPGEEADYIESEEYADFSDIALSIKVVPNKNEEGAFLVKVE